MAQAVGIAWSMVPPTSSHAARHSAGRIRFPPASSEYLNNRQATLQMVAMTKRGDCLLDELMKEFDSSPPYCVQFTKTLCCANSL